MDVKLSQQDIKRYNGYIWKFFIGCFAFVVLLLALTSVGLFGTVKSFRDLENPKSNLASEIISSDNQLLGKYFVDQGNRSRVNFNQISPNVTNALIATEDNHFYTHSGIDFWRTFSIIPYNLLGKKQGASTITQQLARNLFSDEDRAKNPIKRFIQKLQEQITAVKIEKHYTKQEIITMYLNTVSFGSNTLGIRSAAQTYFYTTPDKLTPDQAAVLIAQLKGPAIYSPINHPDRAKNRRNFILGRMAEEGYLNDAQAKEYQAKPLGISYHPTNHYEGIAPYFRAELKKELTRLFTEQGIQKADGTPYDLDRDGLKIYTTINYQMQTYAEDAQKKYMQTLQVLFNKTIKGVSMWKTVPQFKMLIENGMKLSDRYKELTLQNKTDEEIRENFNTPDTLEIFTWKGDSTVIWKPIDSIAYCQLLLRNSMMSMDPKTGYVKAWVGGINFEHFQYDQVKAGKRQVGSTAKSFTYAKALEEAYSPCQRVANVPDTIYTPGSPPWCPASFDTKPGLLTLREALAYSQNWITAHIMKEITPVPVVELIKKLGIGGDVPSVPSICLGTFDASVMEMTAAYSAFVNHGLWTEPTYLLRIEDKNGNVIYSDHQPKVTQALSEQTAYVMTYMLKGVVDITGATGNRLRWKYNFTNPMGGKTGTTNDNSDGWFVGITPQLVTGVWTGFESRYVHFRSTSFGEGANTALPIFAEYMKSVYADQKLGIKKNIDFDVPKGDLPQLDCSVYDGGGGPQKKGANDVEKRLSF
ncbi:MAG: transglycosylase domain-containing protein [Mucilaginibacter sp.]